MVTKYAKGEKGNCLVSKLPKNHQEKRYNSAFRPFTKMSRPNFAVVSNNCHKKITQIYHDMHKTLKKILEDEPKKALQKIKLYIYP